MGQWWIMVFSELYVNAEAQDDLRLFKTTEEATW